MVEWNKLVKKDSIEKSVKDLDDDLSLTGIGEEPKVMNWDLLVILADLSGSMSGHVDRRRSKLDAEKDALKHMIEKGQAGQEIMIVEFPGRNSQADNDVYTTSPTKVTASLLSTISCFHTRGCTPMYTALRYAYGNSKRKNARFILLSDGEPNDYNHEEGFDNVKDAILDLVAKHKEKVTIDVVGIGTPQGGDYDPIFLKQIAKITGGIYTEVANHMQFVKELYKLSPAQRKQITDGKNPIAL